MPKKDKRAVVTLKKVFEARGVKVNAKDIRKMFPNQSDIQAKQGQNPIELSNAVMAYLQTLQQVNVVVETVITTK